VAITNCLKTPHDVIPSDPRIGVRGRLRESRDLAGSALLDLFGEIYFISRGACAELDSVLVSPLGRNDKQRVLR